MTQITNNLNKYSENILKDLEIPIIIRGYRYCFKNLLIKLYVNMRLKWHKLQAKSVSFRDIKQQTVMSNRYHATCYFK